MTRFLVAGLLGLLALGAASVDLVSRSAGLLIQDVSLAALDSADQVPDGAASPDPAASAGPQDLASPTLPPAPEITTIQNILLVGSDSRAGLTDEQMDEMDANDHGGALTDTVLWVQYLPGDQSVRMVAFPRDLAITMRDGSREKINAVRPIEGANALIEQVEEIVGEDLDHYVEIDLAGLVTLTDAVGGVEVCLEEALVDETVGTIPAGRQVLDGIDAGRFVRSRKSSDSWGTGTAGRAARQQYFLRRAMDEVLTTGTLTNPAKLRALVGVAASSLTVDDDLSLTSMYTLANTLRSLEPQSMESAIVPVVAYTDGLYYERLSVDAEELFDALRTGAPFPDDTRSERDSDRDDPDVTATPTPDATTSPAPVADPSPTMGSPNSAVATGDDESGTESSTLDVEDFDREPPSSAPSPTLDPAGVQPTPTTSPAPGTDSTC